LFGFILVHVSEFPYFIQVSRYQREGFVAAVLAAAQSANRRGIRGVAREMKTSNSLDSDNFSFTKLSTRAIQGILTFLSAGMKPDMWTTLWTRVRLSMKAPVTGILIFCAASCAHWKCRHCGEWAVIRNVFDDGVARTAICAINERVEEPSIRGIEQFS
jgi:hypothetical protein